jgi:hypothetical protein
VAAESDDDEGELIETRDRVDAPALLEALRDIVFGCAA